MANREGKESLRTNGETVRGKPLPLFATRHSPFTRRRPGAGPPRRGGGARKVHAQVAQALELTIDRNARQRREVIAVLGKPHARPPREMVKAARSYEYPNDLLRILCNDCRRARNDPGAGADESAARAAGFEPHGDATRRAAGARRGGTPRDKAFGVRRPFCARTRMAPLRALCRRHRVPEF